MTESEKEIIAFINNIQLPEYSSVYNWVEGWEIRKEIAESLKQYFKNKGHIKHD